METYTKDKKAFMQVKEMLDGQVFWREVGDNKVEIRKVCGSAAIRALIESLPNEEKKEETPQ